MPVQLTSGDQPTTVLSMRESNEALPHVSAVMVLFWLSRLCMAFGIVSGLLIAGFAPYSSAMGEVLTVAGGLLFGAAGIGLLGSLLQRRMDLPD